MAWVMVKNGVVIQKNLKATPGFIEAPDNVVCGWLHDGMVFSAPETPPASNEPFRLFKSTLVRRLTEGEAETLKSLLDAAPAKSRMLWEASEWLGSDDPLFATLEQAIGSAIGADRAADILAPDA